MNGMKRNKQPSTKDRIRELEVLTQNLQLATQMSQMMIKHLTNQLEAIHKDMGNTMGMLNDFQYRTLAMLELGDFDKDAIDANAEARKLKDYNSASDKEDAAKNYVNDDAGVVNEDSIVVITSKTPDLEEDAGIFRAKFPMSECLTPDIREKLLGAKVGDSFESTISNVKHEITVLGLRKVEPVEEVKEAEDVSEGADKSST